MHILNKMLNIYFNKSLEKLNIPPIGLSFIVQVQCGLCEALRAIKALRVINGKY